MVDGGATIVTDLKNLSSVFRTRRIMVLAYGFIFTFIIFTAFMVFRPSPIFSSPWLSNIFYTHYSSPLISVNDSTYRSQVPSFISYFFPNSSSSKPTTLNNNISSFNTSSTGNLSESGEPALNRKVIGSSPSPQPSPLEQNRENASAPISSSPSTINTVNSNGKEEMGKNNIEGLLDSLMKCDIFDGNWVKDDSYPLYLPGSCPHIDEPFNCFLNGRPDNTYERMSWKPKHCDLPRLNGKDMLERLRGKRLVFVGDSLNRNMWESLVCVLRNSVKDKSKVFEASGRDEFRTEGSYSFIFKDYNCSVEFFRSPFLVQEWEMPNTNGTIKETLRLDLVERSSSKYKDADVLVFNTGHWWTHEKTSQGKNYYQVGDHVFDELNGDEAFHKALKTWAKWIDFNINPQKTLVVFRGYSASHFSGGQWNSGGSCDSETEPIKNETFLIEYPYMMKVLESVLSEMKIPVAYLNITRMSDYRKDAHPSIYRKQSLSEEERRSPLRYQDCSHWCLPGVPDTWNEVVYAQLLIKQWKQKLDEQQPKKKEEQQQQQQQQQQKQP